MKQNFLYIMAVAAVFASCSNGGDVVDEKGGTNNPAVKPNGEVEVVLGSRGMSTVVTPTRGVVEGWDNTPIVVWGLNKATGADWSNASSKLFPDGAVDATVTNAPEPGTVILGPTGTEQYFYPMNSAVNFSFFACSPRPTTKNIDSRQVTAIYNISGDTDILWGKAETEDPNANGYNAKYIRNSVDDFTPNLQFDHMLTKLTFYAHKGEEINNAGNVTANVKSIRVLNTPSQATVYVAGTRENEIDGTTLTSFPIYNKGVALGSATDQVSPVTPTVEDKGAILGTVMLLPASSYKIQVTLVTKDGKEVVGEDLTITLGGNAPFERGHGYNVQLNVYDLRAVVLKATLGKWNDSTIIDTTVDIN